MDIHKFYPLQEPQPEELDEAFSDTVSNLLRRYGVITTAGIVPAQSLFSLTGDSRWQHLMYSGSGPEFNISQHSAFAFNVHRGMAFGRHAISSTAPTNAVDMRMERITILPTDEAVTYDASAPDRVDTLGNPIPQSTGCAAIPVLPLRTYYVYIRYLHAVDTATDDPAATGSKYTLNPQTGQLGYVHWVDGYQIKLYVNAPSLNPDDNFLGTVTVGVSGITNIDIAGRTYMTIPASLVSSRVAAALAPAGYTAGNQVSMTDHVNAVSDYSVVTRSNPHGTTMGNIPGLLDRFGIYSDSPQSFFTNGIIDTTNDVPGPFWAAQDGAYVKLNKPLTGQAVVINQHLYDADPIYLSEVDNGLGGLDYGELMFLAAQFPLDHPARPTAMYYVFLERTTIAPEYLPEPIVGLAAKAAPAIRRDTGATGTIAELEDMLEHPEMYLATETQYPVALVNFVSNVGIIPFTVDPQTRKTGSFTALDVRRYGTISEHNLSRDRRSYEGLTDQRPVEGTLFRNADTYRDVIRWEIPGRLQGITARPARQAVVKKAGRIRRVTVYLDNPPSGDPALTLDITRNGVANSIFAQLPVITRLRPPNCPNYTGVPNTGMIMDVTEDPATAPDEKGWISGTANYVRPGDRLQLLIPTTPNNCGNELVVVIYIE